MEYFIAVDEMLLFLEGIGSNGYKKIVAFGCTIFHTMFTYITPTSAWLYMPHYILSVWFSLRHLSTKHISLTGLYQEMLGKTNVNAT
ncbi:hypothetical protein GDO81_027710 [Engystomops pustulosus]|uniref:Uncharacterized protein n=1 Tax=Engystomops pustulosus TaxID=76066 RepID=A0AAV6YM19_ENGPU|nr:hypothetical protein GDO81_027710 [Engystomops pustulosus]